MTPVLILFALGAIGFGGYLAYSGMQGEYDGDADLTDDYLRSLEVFEETDEFQQVLAESFTNRVLRPFGERFSGMAGGLLPSNYRDKIHMKLVKAGLTAKVRAEEIVLLQILSTFGMSILAFIYVFVVGASNNVSLMVLVGGPVAGWFVPDALLNRKVEERQEELLTNLPDNLDLLAISVEAGMGFEGALGVVSSHFDTPLAAEFTRTLKEMELGLGRRDALQNLKKRTQVPELSNFILALVQADALGMPIGLVLKTQADELRMKRRMWAREKAAQLPVKIMLPLVLFIFPSVLVVAIGPAIMSTRGAF